MKQHLIILLILIVCKNTYSQSSLQKYLLDSTNKYLSSDELIINIYKDSCIHTATKNNDTKILGELYKILGSIHT